MSTLETAAAALVQAHYGQRALGDAIAALFRTTAAWRNQSAAFAGPSFLQQEPGLQIETARLPAF